MLSKILLKTLQALKDYEIKFYEKNILLKMSLYASAVVSSLFGVGFFVCSWFCHIMFNHLCLLQSYRVAYALIYRKTCVQRPHSKRPKTGFQDQL